MVKISSLATIGGVRTGLEFFQSPILRIVIIWYVWQYPGKLHLEGISLTCQRAHSKQIVSSLGDLSETISGNCLILQLLGAGVPFEDNNKLTKKKKKLDKDVHRELWKTLTYFRDSRRTHVCLGLCTCPGKIWEGPELSPLVDLEALSKQEVKVKAELPEYWRHCPTMITEPFDKDHENYWLQAFKKIFGQSLADY